MSADPSHPRKIRLDLNYVGTDYAGWQLQPDRATVQGTLEAALARVLGSPVRVHGSGRTDSGVHARGQVAHFETHSLLPASTLRSALNHFLPWDIQVMRVSDAPPGFHARESALSKEYRYRIHRGEVMPPHLHPFCLRMVDPLDLEALQRGASGLLGTHDFASLRSNGSNTETSVRTILRSEWQEEGADLVYRVEADGFLYKMVRTIVGTLLEAGRGRREAGSFERMVRSRDRALAGPVVSARGLHLWCVTYPASLEPPPPEHCGGTLDVV